MREHEPSNIEVGNRNAGDAEAELKVADFDYELPLERIAQHAVEPRDSARMLVHWIGRDATRHSSIRDLPEMLAAGDILVVNNTRVRPARLYGRRASGGRVELLMLGREREAAHTLPSRWRALVKPARRLRSGEHIDIEGGALSARAVVRVQGADGSAGAEWILEIRDSECDGGTAETAIERFGHVPLPPYIKRTATSGEPESENEDRARYQTMFAEVPGAIAAPTAGLHFTPDLVRRLRERGIEIAELTLHVGLGTFQPPTVENVRDHRMHAEEFVLPSASASAINAVRARGGRVIAVGTTSTRVLESCVDSDGRVQAGGGETSIFITPGHRFRAIDALLTNFHLPRSTLLMLVGALAGRERILRLYGEAVTAGYRFYSYGDAMLLMT
jgi:S-adenosylmethionine:tRNA ribosyltransferase-isomerase